MPGLLRNLMESAVDSLPERCWFRIQVSLHVSFSQSGYIKCGVFTVHLNSYVFLVYVVHHRRRRGEP